MNTSKLKTLIAQGRLQQAFDSLPDTNEFVLLKARFSRLTSDQQMGTISTEHANLESNRIIHALLQMLEKAADDTVIKPLVTPKNTELNNFKQSLRDIIDTQSFAGTPEVFRKIEESAFVYTKSTLAELRNQATQPLTGLAPSTFLVSVHNFIDTLRIS